MLTGVLDEILKFEIITVGSSRKWYIYHTNYAIIAEVQQYERVIGASCIPLVPPR
jgi:hypothetical protein